MAHGHTNDPRANGSSHGNRPLKLPPTGVKTEGHEQKLRGKKRGTHGQESAAHTASDGAVRPAGEPDEPETPDNDDLDTTPDRRNAGGK
jgi:hypothetical protein